MSPKNKEVTKRNLHTHHLAKTKKQNKLLLISFIITGVVIIGLVGYGVLHATVLKSVIPVAVVNGQKIENQYYEARVRFDRNQYINQFQYIYSISQLFADDQNSADYYQQQLQQIISKLEDVESFGEMVLTNIINDEIIAMQGKEMGIDVSESEIDALFQEILNYFPNGTPTPQPQPTSYPTPTLSKTQEAILNAPAVAENEGGEAVSSESEAEATPVPTETTAMPTLVPGPTATAFTETMFTELYQSYLSDLNTKNVSEKYLRKIFYHYLLNQKVFEALIADVPREVEQIWARHILVTSEEEANDVLARLAAEEWADVASEVSLDTSNKNKGGDLGWFQRGHMVPEFEEAGFALEIGKVSAPVETQFGWHLIQLINRGVLPLSDALYTNEQNAYYQNWLSEVKDAAEIKINDVWKDVVPSDPSIQ